MCNRLANKLNAISIDTSSSQAQCCICLETFRRSDINTTSGECTHNTCDLCMHDYLEKTCRNSSYKDFSNIYCPGLNCNDTFDTSAIVSKIFVKDSEKHKWWSQAIQTAFIKNKVVCPFDECHGIFDSDDNLERKCIFTECQQCHRGFCLTCRKKWHVADEPVPSRLTTTASILATAEKEHWSRCPRCKNMVMKTAGCDHIVCRCGIDFCYRCGAEYARGYCTKRCFEFSQETLDEVRKPMFYLERFSRR